MANILNAYDPQFYCNNALMWLKSRVNFLGQIYRDRDLDATPGELGSTGKMRRPGTFTATAVNTATGGTTQAVRSNDVDITFDNWFEVKFELHEDEIAFGGERLIDDHIGPAAHALAKKIGTSVMDLYKYVPYSQVMTTPAVSDLSAARRILFDNEAPEDDLSLVMSGGLHEALLNLPAFTQADGAGALGVNAQTEGSLMRKFGFNIFPTQLTPTYTTGAMADTAGTLDGAAAFNATSITVDALTDSDVIEPGDTFSIAGNSQVYTHVGAQVTVASSAATLTPSPKLVDSYADGAVVTFYAPASSVARVCNLGFSRQAFGLKFRRLPDPSRLTNAARVGIATDEASGLSLRARMFYEGDKNKMKVSIDALWSAVCLDPKQAVRIEEAP